MTNCFSKIALVIIEYSRKYNKNCSICDSETLTNLAAILKPESLAVIIARENEVLDQLARAIFDNHQCNFTKNKRPSQQPAFGALTFLRSFVAGKANFYSHLLSSLVHFTVVKSQAILIIRLGVAEVIYHSSCGGRLYIFCLPQVIKISRILDMFKHNNLACGLCILIVALTVTMCLHNVSRWDELIKRKKPKKHQYPTFLLNIFQLHSNASENLWCNKFLL